MRCGVGVLGPTVGHAGVTARAGRATGMIGVGAGGDPAMSAPTPALLRSASPSPERGIRGAVCPTGGAAWLRYVCVCVWFPNALRSLKQTPASLAVEIASRWGRRGRGGTCFNTWAKAQSPGASLYRPGESLRSRCAGRRTAPDLLWNPPPGQPPYGGVNFCVIFKRCGLEEG